MKKILALVIALTIGFSYTYAENDGAGDNTAPTTSISGKVIDELTGETLAGVKVNLNGTDTYVFSDFDGNFKFEDLKPAEYDITLSLISYEKIETKVDLNNSDTEPLSIKLKTVK